MDPLKVVCWKWWDPNYRFNDLFVYSADHVNRLYSMVKRHLHMSFDFLCVTDDPTDMHPEVQIVPLWDDLREMGRCYRRLKAFSNASEIMELFGPRFVSIDVDVVITADITPLFSRTEPFIAWKDMNYSRAPYCGSLWMIDAGAFPEVWDSFHADTSPQECIEAGFRLGSDQAWMGYKIGYGKPMWDQEDGVYSFGVDIVKRHEGLLPDDARVVFFHGHCDPSQTSLQIMHPWIREHWR